MNEVINCINKTEIQPNCILTGLGIKRKTKGLLLRHCGDYDCHCDCECYDCDCDYDCSECGHYEGQDDYWNYEEYWDTVCDDD